MTSRTGKLQSNRSSFTLMEMLAVITIIMILAGLLIPTVGWVRYQARKAKATQDMNSLRVALLAYYQEYGAWPDTGSADGWAGLSSLLNGGINPKSGFANGWAGTNNARSIRFLEFKTDNVGPSGEMLDPWGTAYCVILDNNATSIGPYSWNDDAREDQRVVSPAGSGIYIQSQIAIYSFGPDATDNRGANGSDDVKTWTN